MSERQAVVIGTGLYAPPKIVTNEELNLTYGRDVSTFLSEQRNIFKRHFMEDGQTTSDLVVESSKKAMTKAGVRPGDLDLIIVATDTPDHISPSTAAVAQYKLGATHAGTFDVNSSCAGFVTAMNIGSNFISADDRIRHVLVVGASGVSRFLDPDDYKTSTLFADGAGAVVLKSVKSDGRSGILAHQMHTEGQYSDYMGIFAGGAAQPIDQGVLDRKDHLLQFRKKVPVEMNPTHWNRLIRILCDRIGCDPGDVDHFFFTQINIQSIKQTMSILGVPETRSHNIMDQYGYTGSACIAMALSDAVEGRYIRDNDLIMMIGSGGGVSMASLAMRWRADR